MADFEPNGIVYLGRTGVDDQNKIATSSYQDLLRIVRSSGRFVGQMSDCSFMRIDENYAIRMDADVIDYYTAEMADTVLYLNNNITNTFYVWGNVIKLEWKNPNCYYLYYKIDYFMTYQHMIDWEKSYGYIEREHVKDDWSSTMNPLFSNMGSDEQFNVEPDTPVYTYNKYYNINRVLVQSPYVVNGTDVEPNYIGSLKNGLYSSMETYVLTPEEANVYFTAIALSTKASVNNIVGVFGIPGEFMDIFQRGGELEQTQVIQAIHLAQREGLETPIEYNNAKCWSAPFCTIKLMSSDGEVKEFTPQWFGNDANTYTLKYRAVSAGGMLGAVTATFEHRNGSFNYKAWDDFTVKIKELPACPWTGNNFLEYLSNNRFSLLSNAFSAGTAAYAGVNQLAAGPALDAVSGAMVAANVYSKISDILSTINQQRSAGTVLKGYSDINSLYDIGNGCWGFKVVMYTVQSYLMRSIDNYFDRFGYRVNRLKKIDIKTRPYWTFVKCVECHFTSTNSLGFTFTAQNAITSLFQGGCTFWNLDQYIGGLAIGDYSKAKENRGIAS